MRRLAVLLCIASVGCAKRDTPPADPPATGMAIPAGLAGDWRVTSYNARGDSITAYTLHATADTAGWTITFPNRPPVALRVVAVAGDSVTTDAGPYESVLRPGVQVTTRGNFRVTGDTLRGMTLARYNPPGTDSTLQVRSVGVRIAP